MRPRSTASIPGIDLDAGIEQSIADTRARNEAELLGMAAPTLHVNPQNSVINPGFNLTADQQRNAGSNRYDPAVTELQQLPARGYAPSEYGPSSYYADGAIAGEQQRNLDPAYLADLEYWADINAQDGPLVVEITGGASDFANASGVGNALAVAGEYAVGGAETLLGGAYNYGVRLAGGLASIPYLLDSVDAAVAVQEGFAERYNYNLRSQGAQAIGVALQPVGQYVQNNVLNPLRNYSEARIGDAATTTLFAGTQAAFEIGGVLSGAGAVRSLGSPVRAFPEAAAAARAEAAANIRQARDILRETRPDLTIAERNQIIKAFDLESFRVNTISSPVTEFRYFDGLEGGAGLNGRWSTSQWFDTPAERISNLALPNNQATRAATVTLQAGTTVFQGTVAPQLRFGPNLTGGASQTYNAVGPRAVIREFP